MAIARVQNRFQGDSNTPEDVFINTFHFDTGSAPVDESFASDIALVLELFYETSYATTTSASLSTYFSPALSGNVEVRCYDLADPEPRVPAIANWTHSVSINAPLPAEVSLCLSYNAGPPITPRRRGRIYMPPMNSEALATGQTSDSRPIAELVASLAAAGAELANSSNTYRWVVYSPTGGTYAYVTQGFVDNAWDTQRRRGYDATTRLNWTEGETI